MCVCVRLALIVVLDLSSPRGGLGSRIAWGLPWGDFFLFLLWSCLFVPSGAEEKEFLCLWIIG